MSRPSRSRSTGAIGATGRSAALRPTAWRGHASAAPSRWHGPHGSASERGTRASGTDDGCWAGTYASRPDLHRTDEGGRARGAVGFPTGSRLWSVRGCGRRGARRRREVRGERIHDRPGARDVPLSVPSRRADRQPQQRAPSTRSAGAGVIRSKNALRGPGAGASVRGRPSGSLDLEDLPRAADRTRSGACDDVPPIHSCGRSCGHPREGVVGSPTPVNGVRSFVHAPARTGRPTAPAG